MGLKLIFIQERFIRQIRGRLFAEAYIFLVGIIFLDVFQGQFPLRCRQFFPLFPGTGYVYLVLLGDAVVEVPEVVETLRGMVAPGGGRLFLSGPEVIVYHP